MPYRKLRKTVSFFLIGILCLVLVLGGLWWVRQMDEVFSTYIEVLEEEQLKHDVNAVLQTVIKQLSYDPEELMVIEKSSDGYISYVSYNSVQLQDILNQVIAYAEKELEKNGHFQYEMALGMFTRNLYLANSGPKIQLHLQTEPYMQAQLNVKMEPYGINSTLILVQVDMTVFLYTISPVIKKALSVQTNLPLVVQVVPGKSPVYYPYQLTNPIEIDTMN
ncbi:MAG: sporulation protein YunB [Erysipelotrichaceae bacterium]|nr:sporulation protein YunB [Erysipelotrichaceae bacterium]